MSEPFSYESLRTFFRKKVQNQIRLEFKSCCVLCDKPLGPDEGICVPIVQDIRMKIRAESRRFAGPGSCDMKAAANGLLSCEACCKFLASPDGHNDERLSAFVPCLPILNYVNHVIRNVLGEDVDSLRQTVDQILDDLAQDPDLTPERRAAAPFLHCYQLQPTSRRGGTLSTEFLRVSLYDPPASTVINGRSYRIVDPAANASTLNERLSTTMDLPVYEQTASDTTVTLWRIRQRPVGYFMGCVASLGLPEVGDLQLRKMFLSIFSHMSLQAHDIAIRQLDPAVALRMNARSLLSVHDTLGSASMPDATSPPEPPGVEPSTSSAGSTSEASATRNRVTTNIL